MTMILTWKSFQVHLPTFKAWLDENYPKTDGLVCTETECHIIESSTLTPTEISEITTYFNSLTESEEDEKHAKPIVLQANFEAIREAAIPKKWDDMTTLERKIIAQAPLTDLEIEEVYNYES